MERCGVYEDIARRTGGDIYIGVVGPVRTGKSTFIKRFMETLVIPEIENDYMRERAWDELPQSGSGRTIMTAEPKFVPEEAVNLSLDGGGSLSVRLVDCVGYMVPGAMGHMEDGEERLVTTPWFNEPVTMEKAAEAGTRKVIAEHSTMGVVITTDGSFSDIPRDSYLQAEGRVIAELRQLGKPFVVLLNSEHPDLAETRALSEELAREHSVTCIPVNCRELSAADIRGILMGLLDEFPVSEVGFWLPSWMETLESDHPIKLNVCEAVRRAAESALCIRDLKCCCGEITECEYIGEAEIKSIDMGTGRAEITLIPTDGLFYNTISELTGLEVRDDRELMTLLREMGAMRSEYSRVAEAMREVREHGYGVVMPSEDELTLQEPRIVKKGGRYSVKLRATAPSIHLIKADIETEVSPAVGGESASGDIINLLLQGFEGDVGRIWESNIFGKPLHLIAGESLQAKIRRMSPETQTKLRGAVQKIVNDGAGGIFLIVL